MGTGFQSPALLAVAAAAFASSSSAAQEPVKEWAAEGKHHRVVSDVSEEVSKSARDLLEEAWPLWVERFGPPIEAVPRPRLLPVRIFGRKKRLDEAALEAFGSELGDWQSCYDGRTRTVCILHVPVPYYGRGVLLHEATHQYHSLTMPRAEFSRIPGWYYEGVANDFQRHAREGGRLRTGLWRCQTQPDLADEALDRLSRPGWSVTKFLASAGLGRGGGDGEDQTATGWAIVHWFRNADAGRHRKWFGAWEKAAGRPDPARGRLDGLSLSEAEVTRAMTAFLEGEIIRSGPVWGTWEGSEPELVSLHAAGYGSLFALDEPLKPGFDASLGFTSSRGIAPGEGIGFVIGYRSPWNYGLARFHDQGRRFDLLLHARGRWVRQSVFDTKLKDLPAGARAVLHLSAGGGLRVTVNDVQVVEASIPPDAVPGSLGFHAERHHGSAPVMEPPELLRFGFREIALDVSKG